MSKYLGHVKCMQFSNAAWFGKMCND